jgi:hypothetical protein
MSLGQVYQAPGSALWRRSLVKLRELGQKVSVDVVSHQAYVACIDVLSSSWQWLSTARFTIQHTQVSASNPDYGNPMVGPGQ